VVSAEAGHEVVGDVLVIGGGPAGCAAATLLVRLGHRVTLQSKPPLAAPSLGESIPPSTQKLFDTLGMQQRIDAAGFVRATGNTAWWGGDEPRVEYFADGARGWQVTTTALEVILREAAAAAGVHIVDTRVDIATMQPHAATFILDCSGRSGVLARRRRLRLYDGLQTIALVGLWRSDRFEVPDATHTLIESYEGGWIWSVPRSETERFVAAMVDPRTSHLSREAASEAIYRNEIRKAPHLQRLVATATLIDGPRGWDASMYHASRYVDDNVLLVGDAASFIDPLSSAGIKKALASGWLAAVATHTSLVKPHMRQVAIDFFERRERDIYAQFRALTERYWQDAASGHTHAFWSDRVGDARIPGDHDDVAAAFERLRTAADLRVARNPAVHVANRPAISGSEIVLEERLVRGETDAGVRYAHDVDLLALVQLAPSHTSVPDLFEAYLRRSAPVALPDFLAALATAIAHHWLRWCGKT
jgi:flavin-dependent dehydrogenase